jgi:hypothetical protein
MRRREQIAIQRSAAPDLFRVDGAAALDEPRAVRKEHLECARPSVTPAAADDGRQALTHELRSRIMIKRLIRGLSTRRPCARRCRARGIWFERRFDAMHRPPPHIAGRLGAMLLFLAASAPAHAGLILFEAVDLSDVVPAEDLWQYRYTVQGFTFAEGAGFEVFFPLSQGYLHGDLQASPPPPNADWDVLTFQPEPLLPDPGRYDAVASRSDPSVGQAFVVNFVWRGAGRPGSQPFEVFDPAFVVVEAGRTISAVPEPGLGGLLVTGASVLVWLRRRVIAATARKHRQRHLP